MRKSYFLYLALGICILGCGKAGSDSPNTADSALTEMEETEDSAARGDAAEIKSEPLSQTTVSGITIADHKENAVYYAENDDSVPILKAAASFPSVSIADNAASAEKINRSILSELTIFLEFEKSNAAHANEEYLMSLDSADFSFAVYTAELSYQIKRCDDKIISVVFCQNDYSGGAHGNYFNYGLTFDVQTGERLYLEGLSTDYNVFHQILLNDLNEQAVLPAYQNYLFSDISFDLDEALLINSECWYLDRSGISFISNPYVLGPYAAGSFEFNIPYADLTNLKKSYFYDGPYIRKLFPGVSAAYDVNGDDKSDEICYSIQSDENFSDSSPMLIINGSDFSKELVSLDLSYLWTGAYYLIDVDPDDSHVEIAISSENLEQPDNSCTHFFRYDKNDRLIYLGNIPGIFNEDMQVRYNANGNLILYD